MTLCRLLFAVLPLLASLSFATHAQEPEVDLEQLQQLQHELNGELSRLQQQLQTLDAEQRYYLEQSRRLRRQLLEERQQRLALTP